MKIVYGRFVVENEVYTEEEMIRINDWLATISIAGNIDGNTINFAMPMPGYTVSPDRKDLPA